MHTISQIGITYLVILIVVNHSLMFYGGLASSSLDMQGTGPTIEGDIEADISATDISIEEISEDSTESKATLQFFGQLVHMTTSTLDYMRKAGFYYLEVSENVSKDLDYRLVPILTVITAFISITELITLFYFFLTLFSAVRGGGV